LPPSPPPCPPHSLPPPSTGSTTPSTSPEPIKLLITAGPTHEPIDDVRYIGNRSSGRLGVELAQASAARGWSTRLLLGPTYLEPNAPSVDLHRFRTTADLEALLHEHQPWCDVLVMAAAVADFRPCPNAAPASGKLRRTGQNLNLELESTPDLLAGCSSRRRPGQTLIGFALEPRDTMIESARSKLVRKGIDAIIANPLETMESDRIEATLLTSYAKPRETPGIMPKTDFAVWLIDAIQEVHHAISISSSARHPR